MDKSLVLLLALVWFSSLKVKKMANFSPQSARASPSQNLKNESNFAHFPLISISSLLRNKYTMKRSTRSFIALASVTLAGVFSFASTASADTAQVELETTIATSCAFDIPSLLNGTLGADFTNNILDSAGNGGSPATVDLTCNNAGSQLAISGVNFAQPTGANANLTNQSVTVTHPDGTITNDGTTSDPPIAITSTGTPQTVEINAEAVYSAALLAGTYTFTVDLTATP
jgi:hypothetical protein